jgi:hypothetical protein
MSAPTSTDKHALQKYEGVPRKRGRRGERSRWRRFCDFMLGVVRPKLLLAERLGEDYYTARVDEAKAQAEMKSNQAAVIAARADQERSKSVQVFADLVDRQIAPASPDLGADLKLAKLLETFPEIAEQVEKIREIRERLTRHHGVKIDIFVGEVPQTLERAESGPGEGDNVPDVLCRKPTPLAG